MNREPSTDDGAQTTNRRQFVRLLGAGGLTAGLAGCVEELLDDERMANAASDGGAAGGGNLAPEPPSGEQVRSDFVETPAYELLDEDFCDTMDPAEIEVETATPEFDGVYQAVVDTPVGRVVHVDGPEGSVDAVDLEREAAESPAEREFHHPNDVLVLGTNRSAEYINRLPPASLPVIQEPLFDIIEGVLAGGDEGTTDVDFGDVEFVGYELAVRDLYVVLADDGNRTAAVTTTRERDYPGMVVDVRIADSAVPPYLLLDDIIDDIGDAIDDVGDWVEEQADDIEEWIDGAIDDVADELEEWVEDLSEEVEDLADGLGVDIEGLLERIEDAIESVLAELEQLGVGWLDWAECWLCCLYENVDFIDESDISVQDIEERLEGADSPGEAAEEIVDIVEELFEIFEDPFKHLRMVVWMIQCAWNCTDPDAHEC